MQEQYMDKQHMCLYHSLSIKSLYTNHVSLKVKLQLWCKLRTEYYSSEQVAWMANYSFAIHCLVPYTCT